MNQIRKSKERFLVFLTMIMAVFFYVPALSQSGQMIEGVVTDFDGEPLPGVSIIEKGTVNGTITDIDGNYSLKVQGPESIITFSYVGFTPESVTVGNQTKIDIAMVEDIETLTEVVVVGYGTTKKSNLTGAVSSVEGKTINNIPVNNVSDALAGQAAGVQVTRGSGRPGSGSQVQIRGIGSINGDDPLWVVDGVIGAPRPNVEDIESVEILKDAASASIYGNDAAGGVILVTTKRGGKNQKARIEFNSYAGINQLMEFPEPLTSNQYAGLRSRTFNNDPSAEYWSQDFDTSTDWLDEMTRNGWVQNYALNLSGGTEKLNYFISGNYYNEEGTFIETDYQRYNFRVVTDYEVNEWLKVGQTVFFRNTYDSPNGNINVFTDIYRPTPTIPVYDPSNVRGGGYGYIPDDVSAGWGGANPVAKIKLIDEWEESRTLQLSPYFDIIPFDGLKIRTQLNQEYRWNDQTNFSDKFYHSRLNEQVFNSLDISQNRSLSQRIFQYATYEFEVGEFEASLMGGWEASKSESQSISASTQDIINTDIYKIGLSNTDFINADNGFGQSAEYSYFGRLKLNYRDKYLFESNFRNDYSYVFEREYSSDFFPSFSAGWRIIEEQFMRNLTFIDDLKLRVGYGELGFNNIPPYLFNLNYNDDGFVEFGDRVIQAFAIDDLPRLDLTWERVSSWNFATDFGFLANRLTGSLEYYISETKQMLLPVNLPRSSGFQSARQNVGALTNTGFELQLQWKENQGDFSYTIRGNASYNINEVTELNLGAGGVGELLSGSPSNVPFNATNTTVGQPLGSFFGFESAGIIRDQDQIDELNSNSPTGVYQNSQTAPGDLLFRDIASIDENGNRVLVPDGMITEADETFLGNPWPRWVFGLNINLEYKGFDLAAFWKGVAGVEIFNYNKIYYESLFSDYNTSVRALDAWSEDNPGSDIPRLTNEDPNGNYLNRSSHFVEDGSYLRLKTLQIGYSLPKQLANNLKLERLRIYVSGNNLLTFTNYTGVDPEFDSGGPLSQRIAHRNIFPQYKSYLFGVQATF